MQASHGIKRVPLSRATNLPRLDAPAGYLVVIEDVEYGNRFKIARLQEVNARLINRVADLPFETELFLVLAAENATALALELRDRFAASDDSSEWFDLDRAQVAQLRDFGRPPPPSLRDLALSQVGGQSLVEKAQVVSAAPIPLPAPTRAAPKRPQRRWAAWLLLLAIITLGASVLGNAPQLRRLLGQISMQQVPTGRNASAPATEIITVSAAKRVVASPTSRATIVRVGEEFYVWVRANARECPSRECRATRIMDVGTRIVALGSSSGQKVAGETTWIKFRHEHRTNYVHVSVLTRDRPEASVIAPPSATASMTDLPTTTLAPTLTPRATDTVTPTYTVEPTAAATQTDAPEPTANATDKPTASVEPTETTLPPPTATLEATAAATDRPAVLYIETANDLNALVRACPNTDCAILGRLRPGAEIRPTGEVQGEVVYGTALWFAFEYEGRSAYVHGELVAEHP